MSETIGLSLTTSSPRGGVAVLRGNEVCAWSHYDDERMHAERIVEVVDEVMAKAALQRDAIDVVICDVGPGSFTSLRIGMATALGIATALDLPTIGVTGLEAMALGALRALNQPDLAEVLTVIDGKRGEFFVGSFTHHADNLIEAGTVSPRAVPTSELPNVFAELSEAADHAHLCCRAPLLATAPELAQYRIAHPAAELPDAAELGRLGLHRFRKDPSSHGILQAVYLRGADAKMQTRRPCLVDVSTR